MDGLGNLPRALVDGNGRDPLDHQLVTELTVLAALALSGPEALPMGSATPTRCCAGTRDAPNAAG